MDGNGFESTVIYCEVFLGDSEHTHTRNFQFAYEMWDSLKSFYKLQGKIEVLNATSQLSAIIMTESEDFGFRVTGYNLNRF